MSTSLSAESVIPRILNSFDYQNYQTEILLSKIKNRNSEYSSEKYEQLTTFVKENSKYILVSSFEGMNKHLQRAAHNYSEVRVVYDKNFPIARIEYPLGKIGFTTAQTMLGLMKLYITRHKQEPDPLTKESRDVYIFSKPRNYQ